MKSQSAGHCIVGARAAGMKRLKALSTQHKTVGAGLSAPLQSRGNLVVSLTYRKHSFVQSFAQVGR